MRKLVILLGFLFCVTFAVNAQLTYKNGNLFLNVPESYRPNLGFGASVSPKSVSNAWLHLFVWRDSEFYLYPYAPDLWAMGPEKQGTIYLQAGNGSYHNVYLKSIFNISDARAKTNIRPLGAATSTIMKLNPVTYQFINRSNEQATKRVAEADGTETGFLAQELAEVLPNAVVKDSKDQYSVNYISIIPVLVKAVQEQQAQIEALKAEIATLKNR